MARIVRFAGRAGGFGGDQQLVALAGFLQPAAEIGFAQTLGFRLGRHRIHFGHIDQIDAALGSEIKLRVRLLLAVLFAPGHGAERDLTDIETGAAKWTELHVVIL